MWATATYPDEGLLSQRSDRAGLRVKRYGEGTAMAIIHPDNPVAEKSVTRYGEVVRSVSARVADSGHWGRLASRGGVGEMGRAICDS